MHLVEQLCAALNATATSVTSGTAPSGTGPADRGRAVEHHRLVTADGPTVDVLTGAAPPRRVVVLLPGGGLNVQANFCTAEGRSLAQFLAEHGSLVLGITPREDTFPADTLADHGLAAHRRDVLRVVAAVGGTLPYDLLGHSAGAALALDLAAQPGSGARRVFVLDTTGPYDPAAEPELVARAEALCTAMREQLGQGVHTVDPGLKRLFAAAVAAPEASSGFPRPAEAGGGSFGNLALLHFALINTRDLPGPANWIYHRGHSSGSYRFGHDAPSDTYLLDRSPFEVWSRAVAALGTGVQPTALLRDLAALWAGREEVYRIDWAAIRAEVVWLNTAGGRGDHDLGARLIRAGGAAVDYRVFPGYGHGDLVWAPGAEQEVWPLLLDR